MRKLFLILTAFAISFSASAQINKKQRSYWSANALIYSTTLFGDLGGKDFHGSNDFRDMDVSALRLASGLEIQYNHRSGLGLVVGGFYARLYSDDDFTNWNRTYRNLHSRTDIFETYTKVEYTVPFGQPGIGGFYFNVGVGVHHFNPMAEWNGTWYELRPLGTEGQVADPTRDIYPEWSPVIPFAIGKKYQFKNGVILGIDMSFRKSFTDYLDDVSTVYYDQNAILESGGVVAAHFANPSEYEFVGETGSRRGNPENFDTYYLFGFRIHVPLSYLSGNPYNMNTNCSFSDSWFGGNGAPRRIGRSGRARYRLFR